MFDCHESTSSLSSSDRHRRRRLPPLPNDENRTNNARNAEPKHAARREHQRHRADDSGSSDCSDGSSLESERVTDCALTDHDVRRNVDEVWTVSYPAFGNETDAVGNECVVDLTSKPEATVLHRRKSKKKQAKAIQRRK